MVLIVTLWWLFFWTALGLCVGSFLNVVIYRLPRDKSLRDPVWSACPACHHRIRWHDNLPIISFIILRGRCRDCRQAISPRYLFVEAASALVVLLLLDAFFVGQVRDGLSRSEFGLTDHLAKDWPILVAHIVLFASLLAMSAVDMEHYWVDIRFTNFATACGFLFHAIWTPSHSKNWFRPGDSLALMALFSLLGLFLVWLWLRTRSPIADGETLSHIAPESPADRGSDSDQRIDDRSDSQGETVIDVAVDTPLVDSNSMGERSQTVNPMETGDADAVGETATVAPGIHFPSSTGFAACAVLLLVVMLVSVFLENLDSATVPYKIRSGLVLMLFFIVIVRESTVHRQSDKEIIEAIEEERHEARGMVLRELIVFIPVIGMALLGIWLMREDGGNRNRVSEILHAGFQIGHVVQRWAPLEGISTAAAGYVLGGALGWAVRIVFTLIFGREAFATGDIHMMAAAGCVAGWPVVVLGFFITTALALAGWLLTMPYKQARALPLGPWLFLSLLLTTVLYKSIVNSPMISRALTVIDVLILGNSQ